MRGRAHVCVNSLLNDIFLDQDRAVIPSISLLVFSQRLIFFPII